MSWALPAISVKAQEIELWYIDILREIFTATVILLLLTGIWTIVFLNDC